tara:strand:- start:94 stop:1035 length:942 start_codon:yes stop_codon:yes gene_type:complete
MPETKKRRILSDILGGSYQSGDELLFRCPACNHHKNKLSVNIEKDAFKCWICDWSGRSLYRVVRRTGNYSQRQEWKELTTGVDVNSFGLDLFDDKTIIMPEQRVSLPEEFVSLANRSKPITSVPARNYLYSRGVTQKEITRWKIGYCHGGQYSSRVVVPSFNKNGNCNYFVSRTYSDAWKKYLNPPASKNIIFNELSIDWDNDLVITEGVFDAIVAGPNSIPILGSTLRPESRLFQEIVKNDTPIYLALDPDADKKTMRIVRNLLEYDIEIYKIEVSPYPDVAEMGRDEFSKRKELARLIRPEDYLLQIMNSL